MSHPGPQIKAYHGIGPSNRAWVTATFMLAAAFAVALAVGDGYLSTLLSPRLWQRLRLEHAPVRATLLLLPLIVLATATVLGLMRLRDGHARLIVLLTVAMQSNALRLAGVDLLSVIPFIVLAFIAAESLLRPDTPLHLTALCLAALLLVALDLPHIADTNVYGPGRFVINFISITKSVLVGVCVVLLIRDERDLSLALKAMLVVGLVSAAIGVGQLALNRLTGLTLTLALESGEVKPTFLGTVLRASGLTSWAQHLADFSIITFPFVVYPFLRSRSRREALRWGLASAVVLGAVFFTFTYAAYVAVSVIALFAVLLAWRRYLIHLLLLLALAATVAYMAGGVHWLADRGLPRVTSSSGFVEREVYLQAAAAELLREPWLGLGAYADEELSGNFYRKRVHNTGLQAWVYFGLPGFLLFIGTCLAVWTQVWLLALARNDPVQPVFVCLGLALTGMYVSMWAQPNLALPVTWYLLGLASAAVRVHSGARRRAAGFRALEPRSGLP
jgi:hypothetical protein